MFIWYYKRQLKKAGWTCQLSYRPNRELKHRHKIRITRATSQTTQEQKLRYATTKRGVFKKALKAINEK